MVALNRAIAVSRIDGALSGLAALEGIAGRDALERYPLLPAASGTVARSRQSAAAAACYREALELARSAPEQRWLRSRLTHLV